jgi:hypothetical protein
MLAIISQYLWAIYPCLLVIAAYLNKQNRESVLLLLVVALSYYLPMKYVEDYYLWYAGVILAELSVIALSLKLYQLATPAIACVTTLLTLSHITSMLTINVEIYSIVARYLEHLQMIVFIIFSPHIINKLKRKIQCLLLKYGCGC